VALPTYIQDPATGRRLKVTQDGAIAVSVVEISASEVDTSSLTKRKQLREFLRRTTDNSPDLNVNASGGLQEFNVKAEVGKTKWITEVRVIIYGKNCEMQSNDFRRFGDATSVGSPLTNGIKLFVTQGGVQTNFFINNITRMGDFFDYMDDFVNVINAIDSQTDFLTFDFRFEGPVVLPPGVPDKISITINDNLSSLTLFRVIARGYQESI